MPTRRTTLKTLAGGTVVGSLSGCVQLATQETTNFHGSPATVDIYRGRDDVSLLSSAVGVEAHKTVERAGITREIVAHSWGMLYVDLHPDDRYVSNNNTESSSQQQSVMKARSAIATFTTPGIEVAGQELNPIADLTTGEIGTELASLALSTNGSLSAHPADFDNFLGTQIVEDASGQKVLRAFRDAVGSSGEQVDQRMDSPDYFKTSPNWDGEYHEFQSTYREGQDPHHHRLVFDKHNGDFVVVFSVARNEDQLYRPEGSIGRANSITHPPGNEFGLEMLQRHLVETNVLGMQGMVKQARKLIDETQDLLEMGEYEKETLIQTVSNIQRTISDIQETLQECDSDACETVLRHAEDRSAHTQDAKQALQNNNPGNALQSLQQARAIIQEDIALLEDRDNNTAERALELERTLLDDTDRASLSAAQWQTLLSTHEALNQVDQQLSKVEDDLSSVLGGAGKGGIDGESLKRVRETSKKTAEIATNSHERVASYNNTRNEEDERFLQIERNLSGILALTKYLAAETDKHYAWYEGWG